MANKIIIIISWPSWVWKDALLKTVINLNNVELWKVKTMTTRKPRESIEDRSKYNFMERDIFEKMIENWEIAEYSMIHWNYYWVSFKDLEDNLEKNWRIIYELDVKWAKTIKERLDEKYKTITIFLAPSSIEVLKERIISRWSETEETLRIRLETAESEMKETSWYDYVIVNDDINEASKRFIKIIKAA